MRQQQVLICLSAVTSVSPCVVPLLVGYEIRPQSIAGILWPSEGELPWSVASGSALSIPWNATLFVLVMAMAFAILYRRKMWRTGLVIAALTLGYSLWWIYRLRLLVDEVLFR